MRIGLLLAEDFDTEAQAALGSYPGLFHRLLAGHGFHFRTWDVRAMAFPDSPDEADGWLITGSTAGTYEDHPWIAPLQQKIRDIRDSGRPLVGICFGHQIIAQALGGKVEKHAGGWCVGRQLYEIDGQELALNAWHGDQVVALPPDAVRVGRSESCENAALTYGSAILTYQPHPEFDAIPIGHFSRTLRDGNVPNHLLDRAELDLSKPTDGDRIGARIAAHFLNNRL